MASKKSLIDPKKELKKSIKNIKVGGMSFSKHSPTSEHARNP